MLSSAVLMRVAAGERGVEVHLAHHRADVGHRECRQRSGHVLHRIGAFVGSMTR
jgi:hypothetical protein